MSERTWFKYDDHNDTQGDGYITISHVSEHTGRLQRTDDLTLTTDHGNGRAVLTVAQTGTDAFIAIDEIVDGNGVAVATLSANAFVEYWIVGRSNCPLLDVVDQSIVAGTSLNERGAEPHSTGFTLVEKDGVGPSHSSVPLNTVISPDYGAANSFQFRIPFLTNRNTGAARTITMSVYNTSLSLVATLQIQQNAGSTPSVEEEAD